MGKFLIFFFTAFCAAILGSCVLDTPPPPSVLPDAYEGSLSVLFVDGNGQNLAKGMSESIVIPNIGNRYYKLWQTIGKDSKPIPVYNLSFVNPRKDDYYISFHFVTKNSPATDASFDFQCEHIFGDREFHRIIARYDVSPKNYRYYICSYFSIDGKEYPVDSSGRVTVKLESSRPE